MLVSNRYTIETEIEISKLGPTRIEGRNLIVPANTKFDCQKGTFPKRALRIALSGMADIFTLDT